MTLSSVISHFELSLNSSKGHGRNPLGELVVMDETWGGGGQERQRVNIRLGFSSLPILPEARPASAWSRGNRITKSLAELSLQNLEARCP